ncbi:MAG: GNAT family N-acetyltransferase [Marinilabiliales bacterium]|nr:MAG: GNAT family N-acetyltransferase [Marinilabiliales bacterium]
MLEIKKINRESEFDNITRGEFVDFLFTHLERFGDPKKDINKCLDYAFSKEKSEGGFVLAAFYNDQLAGGLIMNKTGMGDYIPDWVLVYVAVDATYRGKGFGKQIIERAFAETDGNVKLHVEYDNPAKRLYERLGFANKYAEMRYERNK